MTYPSPDQNPAPYSDPLAPPPVTPSYPPADPYAQPASPYAAPVDPYTPVPPQPVPPQPPSPYGVPQPPYGTTPPTSVPPYGTTPSYAVAPESIPPYDVPPPTPAAGYGVPYQQQAPGAGGVNGFAIASLVLSIFGGILLSVVFGFVALSQIRKRNQTGRGMAVAGLVISGLWLAGICTAVAIAIAVDDTPADGTTGTGDDTSVHSLRIGDCLNELEDDEEIDSLPVVPCSTPHDGEVYAEFRLTGSTYPGLEAIQKEAEDRCVDLLESYAPEEAADPKVDTYFLYPTDESWRRKNDRLVTCVATFTAPRTGSIKD